eukprot:TRINITY_DN496_c3_g1_i1.p1 TRINITY_DN496_c3_g1~~TRINITY_DN496_c3_g1_i1.p1  ORF type:complete len:641 (+),score=91.98 TRINITY_DN496_c3_g1_i1:42-1964(+)
MPSSKTHIGRVAAPLLLMAASASGAALRELDVIDCTQGRVVNIEIKPGRVAVEDVLEFDTRAYHFEGSTNPSVPGSTIKMHPGQQCTLRVTNNLVGTPCNVIHSNDYHCPDTHTLHTHGLHVSPNEDNIDTHIEPNGDTHDYIYNIPEEHLMGTHWYHAHHHGSTAMQVGSGLAGMLLVEPHESYSLPADLEALYNDDGYRVPPMLFFHHQLTGFGNGGLFGWISQQELLQQTENNVPLNLNILDASPGLDFYSVNGQYNPTVTLTQNVATLLRMVHGGGNKHITLTVNSNSCSLLLISRDGVFHSLPYLSLQSIHFIQGTRADVAIRCTEAGTFSVSSSSTVGLQVSTGNGHDQTNMFEIEVLPSDGTVREMPTSAAPMPDYLANLRNADDVVVGGRTGVQVVAFNGGANLGVNGAPFPGFGEGSYVESFCLDTKYEMQLGNRGNINVNGPGLSAGTPHPYHQHINHFQVVDGRDPSGHVIRDGEWRDVVPAWGVVMRFYPVRFTGEVVIHCHMLQHEDQGMMGLYLIEQCSTPAPPTDAPIPETNEPVPETDAPIPETDAPVPDADPCSQFTSGMTCGTGSCDGTRCVWERTTSVCSCPSMTTDQCEEPTTQQDCQATTCATSGRPCRWDRMGRRCGC